MTGARDRRDPGGRGPRSPPSLVVPTATGAALAAEYIVFTDHRHPGSCFRLWRCWRSPPDWGSGGSGSGSRPTRDADGLRSRSWQPRLSSSGGCSSVGIAEAGGERHAAASLRPAGRVRVRAPPAGAASFTARSASRRRVRGRRRAGPDAKSSSVAGASGPARAGRRRPFLAFTDRQPPAEERRPRKITSTVKPRGSSTLG